MDDECQNCRFWKRGYRSNTTGAADEQEPTQADAAPAASGEQSREAA